MRRKPSIDWNRHRLRCEAGKPLKAALEKVSQSTTPAEIANLQNKSKCEIQSVIDSNEALDRYIREVFWQLDQNKNGKVLKEDFELLCDVLLIPQEVSNKKLNRNSGIEWLSYYNSRQISNKFKMFLFFHNYKLTFSEQIHL